MFSALHNLDFYVCSLKTLTSPLLILHSEDDNIVPYHMGLEVQLLLFLSI